MTDDLKRPPEGSESSSKRAKMEESGTTTDSPDKDKQVPKYNKKFPPRSMGKLRRPGRESRGDPRPEREGDEDAEKEARLPKRMVAVLMSFCGSNYRGMQFQPDIRRSVENKVFEAMCAAGAVSKDNSNNPTKVRFSRAARTDAGVHAAGNLISLKMIPHIPGVPDVIEKINEELPEDIRLWGYVRTLNSFNARLSCDSRRYTYFFPTYLLIPPKPGTAQYKRLKAQATESGLAESLDWLDDPFWSGIQPENDPAEAESSKLPSRKEDLARKRVWRVPETRLEALRRVAKMYEGTHNFHNFTLGREFRERSCLRHMKSIKVADPKVYGETEWISVEFHGDSFMLHQIRKMMAAMIMLARTGVPSAHIMNLYREPRVLVPKIPALGLLLEHPLFGSYNAKVAEHNKSSQVHGPDDVREPIEFEQHAEKIAEFKERYIYRNMRGIEDRDALFDAWIRFVDSYKGDDFGWINWKNEVPESAVIKGKRAHAFKERKRFDATVFVEKEAEVDEDEEEEEEVLDKKNMAETEG